MNLGPITDPDMLALLREITSDPESRLMKLATKGADASVRLREPALSEREPFLTRVERHLLREHREAVAQLLFEIAKKACLEAPQLETLVYRGPDSVVTPVLDAKDVERQRTQLIRHEPADSEAIRLLEDALATGTDRFGRAAALASLRLVPRDSARNHLALACFSEGRRKDGFAALNEILDHRASDWYRSVALQNKAFDLGEEGELDEAKNLYREAFHATNSRPGPLTGLLIMSLRTLDEEGALYAASTLVESDEEAARACLEEHASILRDRQRRGTLTLPRIVGSFAQRMESRLPEGTGVIARACAEGTGDEVEG